jgi:tRNA pseudouridine38-40 synthase
MARYFITLSYNGSNFNGWQIQQNTPNTIQQVLEEKFSLIFKEKVAVTGCGRTDTGVHAKNYVAHIDLLNKIILEKDQLIFKLNKILPPGISIHAIRSVKDKAHARFDAQERVYHYYLSQEKNPFRNEFTYYLFGDLDFELMNQAAQLLPLYQDFTSFSKLHTQNKTNFCKITEARWMPCGPHEWLFKIRANRFLRGMVRAIVGTLILVGRKKISVEDFKKIIESKDRKLAGNNAPAHALFLCGIKFPNNIYN